MKLFTDIDLSETARVTRLFLEHDFQHCIQLLGADKMSLKSPQWSFEPKSPSAGNHQEKAVINQIASENVVNCIVTTIRNCASSPKKPSQQILSGLYIDSLSNWDLAEKLGYEHAQFMRLKKSALCEFADRFEHWKIIYNLAELPTLIVYEGKNQMIQT